MSAVHLRVSSRSHGQPSSNLESLSSRKALLFDVDTFKICSATSNASMMTWFAPFSSQNRHWMGCVPNHPDIVVCKIPSISMLTHGFRIKQCRTPSRGPFCCQTLPRIPAPVASRRTVTAQPRTHGGCCPLQLLQGGSMCSPSG